MPRLIFCVITLLFLTSSSNESNSVNRKNTIEQKNILIVEFPTDGGQWTDPIISTFKAQLSSTKMDFKFYTVSWTWPETKEDLLRTIDKIDVKIDVVFLPDDLLYLNFAKDIQDRTGAFILFQSSYLKKSEIDQSLRQSGVFCEAPIKNLVKAVRRFMKLDSVGIVGGPFADKISSLLIEKFNKEGIKTEFKKTNNWSEYTKISLEFNKKYDAVMPLAPFGVKTLEGVDVEDHQINSLSEEINKPTIGYGRLRKSSRTVDMNIDPEAIGRNSAGIIFDYFQSGKAEIKEFTSFGFDISAKDVRRFELKIPENMLGFVTID